MIHFAFVCAFAFAYGCSDDPTRPDLPKADFFTVAGLPDTLLSGDTVFLRISARTTSGDSAQVPDNLTWSVTDTRVATVDSTGMLIASGEGPALIRVQAGVQVDEASFFVKPGTSPVASVAVGRGVICALRADGRGLLLGRLLRGLV